MYQAKKVFAGTKLELDTGKIHTFTGGWVVLDHNGKVVTTKGYPDVWPMLNTAEKQADYLNRTGGKRMTPALKEAVLSEVRKLVRAQRRSEATVQVKNLSTGEIKTYTGISTLDAVIAAYAQSKNDWNTWDYKRRYGGMVKAGRHVYTIGDWSVFQDGRKIEGLREAVLSEVKAQIQAQRRRVRTQRSVRAREGTVNYVRFGSAADSGPDKRKAAQSLAGFARARGISATAVGEKVRFAGPTETAMVDRLVDMVYDMFPEGEYPMAYYDH